MRILIGILLLITTSLGWSEVVFMGIGKDGEASFSDAAQSGFAPVNISVLPVDEEAAATMRRTTAEIEDLATAMAEERRARTPVRASSSEYVPIHHSSDHDGAQVDRYYPYPEVRNLRRGQRPPAVAPAPVRPPRDKFEPAFYPRSLQPDSP